MTQNPKLSRLSYSALVIGAALSVALPTGARAASGGGPAGLVSVSGGIAAPSASTSVFENPAGMAQLRRLEALATAGFPNSMGKDGTYGLGLNYGKQGFGLAAGGLYSPTPKVSEAYYGLAVEASSLKTRFGISGQSRINPGAGSTFDLGALVELSPQLQLGFTAIDVEGNPNEYGFGLAAGIASEAWLVVDLTVEKNFNRPALGPGLRVGGPEAQLGVSYGFKLSSKDPYVSGQIHEGFALGGGIKLGQSVMLEAYYQKFSKYFAAVAIGL